MNKSVCVRERNQRKMNESDCLRKRTLALSVSRIGIR
jgi:hypothetical protein